MAEYTINSDGLIFDGPDIVATIEDDGERKTLKRIIGGQPEPVGIDITYVYAAGIHDQAVEDYLSNINE